MLRAGVADAGCRRRQEGGSSESTRLRTRPLGAQALRKEGREPTRARRDRGRAEALAQLCDSPGAPFDHAHAFAQRRGIIGSATHASHQRARHQFPDRAIDRTRDAFAERGRRHRLRGHAGRVRGSRFAKSRFVARVTSGSNSAIARGGIETRERKPERSAGACGWVKVTFAANNSPPLDIVSRWIDESYRLHCQNQRRAFSPSQTKQRAT